MNPSLIPAVWSYFFFNLLLQVFDGVLTYQVVSIGVPEANPLVRQAIIEWGAALGLFYWKLLACALLALIFALTYGRQALTIKAFTVTGVVYGSVSFVGLCALLVEFIG
ncbi:MAG TPA: DUF5658 family protein [Candidatus Binatia bacterium]|jgi:hypothetical protein